MSGDRRPRRLETRWQRRQRPPRGTAATRERWIGFLAFWLTAALVFATCGVGTLVAVHHGRRLGAAFLLGALVCVGVASIIRRSAPRDD